MLALPAFDGWTVLFPEGVKNVKKLSAVSACILSADFDHYQGGSHTKWLAYVCPVFMLNWYSSTPTRSSLTYYLCCPIAQIKFWCFRLRKFRLRDTNCGFLFCLIYFAICHHNYLFMYISETSYAFLEGYCVSISPIGEFKGGEAKQLRFSNF